MMHQCDHVLEMDLFRGEYCSSLSSDDLLDPELPLLRKAKGGTMVLWKKHLDSFIYCSQGTSSSFLPIVFSPPGYVTSIHLSIYLPTAGKDTEFVEEILKIENCVEKLLEKHEDAVLYIRGDANVNHNNITRNKILKRFCDKWNLVSSEVNHPTYHHFVGQGKSDSQLDVLLHSEMAIESLTQVICKLSNPLVTSHHDVLLSSFSLKSKKPALTPDLPCAPRIPNKRVKVHWCKPGIEEFKKCVGDNLARLRSTWLDPSSVASISVLLQSTNSFLDRCARETNPTTCLSSSAPPKSARKPLYVIISERKLLRSYNKLRSLKNL